MLDCIMLLMSSGFSMSPCIMGLFNICCICSGLGGFSIFMFIMLGMPPAPPKGFIEGIVLLLLLLFVVAGAAAGGEYIMFGVATAGIGALRVGKLELVVAVAVLAVLAVAVAVEDFMTRNKVD